MWSAAFVYIAGPSPRDIPDVRKFSSPCEIVNSGGKRVFWRKKKFTYEQQRTYVIQTIRDFLDGTGGPWDWDDFISIPTGYQDLDAVQSFCLGLPADYPPTERGGWCNSDGLHELRRKLEQLEAENRTKEA